MQLLFLLLASTCPATLAERQGYTVCYDTTHQRPLWTIHQPQPATASYQRKHWRIDRELNSLPPSAFTNTGFDRGHLDPAADLPDSEHTHLTSNAVAQNPAINRGSWRKLEIQIRKRGNAKVLTGAIYNDCGNEMIEAPCVIYKIATFPDGETITAFVHNAPRRQ